MIALRSAASACDLFKPVCETSDGDFVVAWSRSGLNGVMAQRYDASGAEVGSAFRVNATQANMQNDASVTTLANGNFVVTWSSLAQDGSGFGVFGQIYTQAGATVGGEFRLNTTTSNSQNHASVTALSDGGFVAVWTNEFADARLFDVYARRFNELHAGEHREMQIVGWASEVR